MSEYDDKPEHDKTSPTSGMVYFGNASEPTTAIRYPEESPEGRLLALETMLHLMLKYWKERSKFNTYHPHESDFLEQALPLFEAHLEKVKHAPSPHHGGSVGVWTAVSVNCPLKDALTGKGWFEHSRPIADH